MQNFLLKILIAQTALCTPDPALPNSICNPTKAGDIPTFIYNSLGLVAGFIGIVVIAMVVYSGIRMIISQGNDEELSKAKSAFKWSIAGFILVLLAYVIVSAISEFFAYKNIDPNDVSGVVNPIGSKDILILATNIFTGILQITGLIAILFIIINGFRYITARGDEEQTSKAKQGLQWAIIGLVITILAYVIVAAVLSLTGHELNSTGSRVVF